VRSQLRLTFHLDRSRWAWIWVMGETDAIATQIKLGRFELATILASYKDIFVQCGRWIKIIGLGCSQAMIIYAPQPRC
jgi:hypothetical protein